MKILKWPDLKMSPPLRDYFSWKPVRCRLAMAFEKSKQNNLIENNSYKSQFSDGRPDGYGTVLYSFLYQGLKGDPNFLDLVIFCFGVEISLYELILKFYNA
jgi:hypothetical protein